MKNSRNTWKQSFAADEPPPSHVFQQVALMAASHDYWEKESIAV
jgi:hypothetical protein